MAYDLTKPPANGHLDPEGQLIMAGDRHLVYAAQASLLTADLVDPAQAAAWDLTDRALAAPDRAYVVGRYIHGGKPMNRNGHIFRIEELDRIHPYVRGTALDMLHNQQRIVGNHIGSRIVPPGAAADGDPFANVPVMEVAAQVWTHYFPAEASKVAAAFERGAAFLSHSSHPESVECDICHHQAPWDGYTSNLYCDHMQGVNAKWFNNPLFLGGALIIPPVSPGWSDARLLAMRSFLASHPDAHERTFAELAAAAADDADLSQLELETMAADVLALAHYDDPDLAAEITRRVGPGWEKQASGYDHIDLTPPHADLELTPTEVRAIVDAGPDAPVPAAVADWALERWTDMVRADLEAMAAKKDRKSKWAMSDGSFPIDTLTDLRRGMNAFQSAPNQEATKRHLLKRAHDLGAPPKLLDELKRLEGRPRADTAPDTVETTGVIVAIVPPAPLAQLLASVAGFPAEELHITLAYFGKTVAPASDLVQLDDLSAPVPRERIMGVLAAWSRTQTKLLGKISGRGTFDQGDAGETTYVSIDAPGLNELRASLVDALEAAGIAVSLLHGFTPHLTLTDEIPPGQGPTDVPTGETWLIDGVELWWGGWHETVPLP